MSPEFLINTQRLQLRLLSIDEAADFAQLIQDSPSLHQWIDWCYAHFNQQEAERFILATRLNWIKADAYGFAVVPMALRWSIKQRNNSSVWWRLMNFLPRLIWRV